MTNTLITDILAVIALLFVAPGLLWMIGVIVKQVIRDLRCGRIRKQRSNRLRGVLPNKY